MQIILSSTRRITYTWSTHRVHSPNGQVISLVLVTLRTHLLLFSLDIFLFSLSLSLVSSCLLFVFLHFSSLLTHNNKTVFSELAEHWTRREKWDSDERGREKKTKSSSRGEEEFSMSLLNLWTMKQNKICSYLLRVCMSEGDERWRASFRVSSNWKRAKWCKVDRNFNGKPDEYYFTDEIPVKIHKNERKKLNDEINRRRWSTGGFFIRCRLVEW